MKVREPDAETGPRPVMVMSLASCVCQFRMVNCPAAMTSGLAERVAVGAGAAWWRRGRDLGEFLTASDGERNCIFQARAALGGRAGAPVPH